jgi:mediator of RNA polymerase II transcription subunit 7
MADEEQPEFLSSYFPDPPPFYKHFTTENQDRLKQAREAAAGDDEDASSVRSSASQLLSLPPEVRYLVPPEPPADDSQYRVFGQPTKTRGTEEFDNIMTFVGSELERMELLPPWKYTQLYDIPTNDDDPSAWTRDRQHYLLRFMRSILVNYVELLGILVNDPTSEERDKKLGDILNIVANAHALVNEYRPHQARETLMHMMEDQLERKRAEIEGVRKMKAKVEETLAEFKKAAPQRDNTARIEDDARGSLEEKDREMQRHMWYAMDEILGH